MNKEQFIEIIKESKLVDVLVTEAEGYHAPKESKFVAGEKYVSRANELTFVLFGDVVRYSDNYDGDSYYELLDKMIDYAEEADNDAYLELFNALKEGPTGDLIEVIDLLEEYDIQFPIQDDCDYGDMGIDGYVGHSTEYTIKRIEAEDVDRVREIIKAYKSL